jgi:hypothetical protein
MRHLLQNEVRPGGAGVAQLVERDLAKVEVVGSRPITRSIFPKFPNQTSM